VRVKELEERKPAEEVEEVRWVERRATVRLRVAGWCLANTGQNSRKWTVCQYIYWISFEWGGKVLKNWGLKD
jgi:hypothetical protein